MRGIGPLKREQIIVLDWFASLGVECFVSDGQTLERFAEKHRRGLPPLRKSKGSQIALVATE